MYDFSEQHLAEAPERTAPQPPPDRLRPRLTPTDVLALQRAGVGNQHLSRAVLARVGTGPRTARKAHTDIDELLPKANVTQSAELMKIRNAHLKPNGERDFAGNLSVAEEAVLAPLKAAIDATPVVVPLPPPSAKKKGHAKGKTSPIDAALEVLKTGGQVESLAQAFLVAKLNTVGKRDIWITDGTTLDTVETGALAQGYTKFQHVKWHVRPTDPAVATAAVGKPWAERAWCNIFMNTVGHPSEAELRADIQRFLSEKGFKPVDVGGPAVVVALGLTNHDEAQLTAALNLWHPGIALDKTKRGQFRVDQPHPQVDNPHHSKLPHIHLQPVGAEQTTILFGVK